ncbi:MAG TPA: polysaccharide deacetylase family protein, partial [bacterium]|nr:polysaccharide deacetylase family protein [bacterium]
MKKTILAFCLALAPAVGAAPADLPRPQVAPWNGHKAAVSLTFDDSDPSHLDVAIPELERRGLRGTFFLIANRTDRKAEWRKAYQAGQELGNHSLDHLHAAGLAPDEEKSQVVGAQTVLQNAFGVPFLTFAYPYTEITPGLLKW